MLLRFLSGLYLGNETTNKLNEGQYSADHCADVFKNRIGSACWCVFGMEHTALHMEMLITDLRTWLERYKQKLMVYKTTHLSLDTSSHPPVQISGGENNRKWRWRKNRKRRRYPSRPPKIYFYFYCVHRTVASPLAADSSWEERKRENRKTIGSDYHQSIVLFELALWALNMEACCLFHPHTHTHTLRNKKARLKI